MSPTSLPAPVPSQVVISSAFESSLGVAQLVQLATVLDQGLLGLPAPSAPTPPPASSTTSATTAAVLPNSPSPPCHGLGTLRWFERDVVAAPLSFKSSSAMIQETDGQQGPTLAGPADARTSSSMGVMCSASEAQAVREAVLRSGMWTAPQAGAGSQETSSPTEPASTPSQGNGSTSTGHSANASSSVGGGTGTGKNSSSTPSVFLPSPVEAHSTAHVSLPSGTYVFRILEMTPPPRSVPSPSLPHSSTDSGATSSSTPSPSPTSVLLLHGFLGSSDDWRPLMHGLAAAGSRCVAMDLPGKVLWDAN